MADAVVRRTQLICKGTKRDGTPCRQPPALGSDYCRFHGGHAPKGKHNHLFRHGKYSKLLRRDILRHYFHSLQQEDMYTQRDEIALLDARISLLSEQLSNADGIRLYEQMVEVKIELEELVDKDEVSKKDLSAFSSRMSDLLTEAKGERRRWREIYDVMEVRRRLIESDRKRMLEQQEYLTKQQAQVLVATLINVLHKNIPDAITLRNIAAEFDAISRINTGNWSIAQSGE